MLQSMTYRALKEQFETHWSLERKSTLGEQQSMLRSDFKNYFSSGLRHSGFITDRQAQ